MKTKVNIADLPPECVAKITGFEFELRQHHKENIILVAYKSQEAES